MNGWRQVGRRSVLLTGGLILVSVAGMFPPLAASGEAQDQTADLNGLEKRVTEGVGSATPAIVALVRKRQPLAPNGKPVPGSAGFLEPVACGIVVRHASRPSDRLVLTTCHAIESVVPAPDRRVGASIDLILAGPRPARASLVSADSRIGLAVLKIDATGDSLNVSDIPSIALSTGESYLAGRILIATGNPAAIIRDGRASGGLASLTNQSERGWNGVIPMTVDRDLVPPDLSQLWQIDSRAPGAADGGAILGLDGRLAAVTTVLVNLDGVRQDTTFACPLSPLAAILLDGQSPRLGWLGFELQDGNGGVSITRVAPNSPADEAGLQPGDVIVQWNESPCLSAAATHRQMWLTAPGESVELLLKRTAANGVRERSIDLRTIVWPVRPTELVLAAEPAWPIVRGLGVDDSTARLDFLPDGLFGRIPGGVLIRSVAPHLPEPLQAGKRIAAIDGEEVTTPDEFIERVKPEGPHRLRLDDGAVVLLP